VVSDWRILRDEALTIWYKCNRATATSCTRQFRRQVIRSGSCFRSNEFQSGMGNAQFGEIFVVSIKQALQTGRQHGVSMHIRATHTESPATKSTLLLSTSVSSACASSEIVWMPSIMRVPHVGSAVIRSPTPATKSLVCRGTRVSVNSSRTDLNLRKDCQIACRPDWEPIKLTLADSSFHQAFR
jgi:hypothetical protein